MFTVTIQFEDGDVTLRNFAVVRDPSGFWKLQWVGASGNVCARKFHIHHNERKLRGQELVDMVENIVGRKLRLDESQRLLEPGGVRMEQ
jgi:hypothetical protein